MCIYLSGCDNTVLLAPEAPTVSSDPVRVLGRVNTISHQILEDFSQTSGIAVIYDEYDDDNELQAVIEYNPSAYDVIIVRDTMLSFFRKKHLLHPVNLGKLPEFRHLEWKYLNQAYDPGNRYSVPCFRGVYVLTYRHDAIHDSIDSWHALWNSSYTAHVAMPGDQQACLSIVQAVASTNIQRIVERFYDHSGRIEGYMTATERLNALEQGRVWMAPLESGLAVELSMRNTNVSLVLPEEGCPLWMDVFAIPRDAEHLDAAYQFINYMMDPEVTAESAAQRWCLSLNKEANAILDPMLTDNSCVNPDPGQVYSGLSIIELDMHDRAAFNRAWSHALRGVHE